MVVHDGLHIVRQLTRAHGGDADHQPAMLGRRFVVVPLSIPI